MLTTIFTAFMYGPAMPLMYFFGMLGLFILYWVDKYMGINIYLNIFIKNQ